MTTDPKPLSTIRDASVRKKLARLCAEYRELHDELKGLEAGKRALMGEIAEISKKNRLVKVAGDGWLLTKTKGRASLKKELLLEKGVPIETIEYATVEGKPYYTVLERKPD